MLINFAHDSSVLRVHLTILLLLCGCTSHPAPTVPAPATQSAIPIPPDRILIHLQTVGCGCQFGQVEFAWIKLPGVGEVKWELEKNRVWLIFLDDQRPTDDAIRAAIADFDVGIASIHRPASIP